MTVLETPQPTTQDILEKLRRLEPAADPHAAWEAFEPEEWPTLFQLVDLAADLPPLAGSSALERLPRGLWPEFHSVAGELLKLQALAQHPRVPKAAKIVPVRGSAELALAQNELVAEHCTHVSDLLDPAGQRRLEAAVAELEENREGQWGPVEPDDSPALHAVVDEIVGGQAFGFLTGYRPERDECKITLSLQELEPAGIAWHRDLYWPREWLGQDVFALFYSLGDDSPEKGGAFVYYLPESNAIRAFYRRRHQATILWNARAAEERILHAVAGYHGAATDRRLLIVQCLRRAG